MATPFHIHRPRFSGQRNSDHRKSGNRTTGHRSALRHLFRVGVVSCAVIIGGTLTVPASADPPLPDTASEAAQRVAELGRDLGILQEEQNTAQVVFDGFVTDANAARSQVELAEASIEALDVQLRSVARSAFAGDRLGSLSAMLTSGSPQEFLDRVNTLENISQHNGAVLAAATNAREQASKLTAMADAAVAQAQTALSEIAAREADLQTQIDTFEDLYAQLSAAERSTVTGGSDGSSGGGGMAPPGEILAPSEAARIAVETAYAQIGDPYVWGADGPDSFDCSGLTMYSYAAAGVYLPHSSSMQSQMGVPVSRSELQPGDLVFYYSPVSHVALYVGDGQIIQASTYGVPVGLSSVDQWGAYNSARRIAG